MPIKALLDGIYFKAGNVVMYSQLIQGTFTKYRQLIPDAFQCTASFSAPLLAQRLNMIDENAIGNSIVRFMFRELESNEQVCSIGAGYKEGSEYELTCPVKFEGTKSKIAFNYYYILEAIKPFSMCTLELTSLSSPGKFTGDIKELTYVVMPMFVQW